MEMSPMDPVSSHCATQVLVSQEKCQLKAPNKMFNSILVVI